MANPVTSTAYKIRDERNRKAQNLKKGYVDGPFGQIHYREIGDGPTLFLLHQSPLSGAMFSPAMPILAERGFRTIAIDTPGYGMSDGPALPATVEALSDAIVAATAALATESFFLLGHHTGAVFAANIAARKVAPVDRVVLNGVPILTQEERDFYAKFEFGPIEFSADGSHLTDAWNQRLFSSEGWTNLPAMHKHTVEMLANSDRYYFAFEAVFAHDIEADFMKVACPAMVLTNSGEDLYQASMRASHLRPDMTFACLDGGTHDIIDEQPENWSAAVSDYLLGTTG